MKTGLEKGISSITCIEKIKCVSIKKIGTCRFHDGYVFNFRFLGWFFRILCSFITELI